MSYIPQTTLQKIQALDKLSAEDFDAISDDVTSSWIQGSERKQTTELLAGMTQEFIHSET